MNFSEDLISIIMPAYCAKSTIGEAIQSVLEQTYPNWELIVANDCSPDDTALIVEAFSRQDKRVMLVNAEINGGPATARNLALCKARGRWIAFLDSDDFWLPTKLSKTIEFAKLNDSALTYTGYKRVNADCTVTGDYISAPSSLNYYQLLGNTAINTSTVLIDRSKTGVFFMKNTYYDDFACWLDILKRGFIAYGLNVDLTRYRVLSGSVSRNKIKSAFEVWKAYRNVESLGLVMSSKYFVTYALNAFLKYKSF